MSDTFKYDIFLSHNSKDKPLVRKLAERLKQSGLRLWFDEWIIKPGDDIFLQIEQGLQGSRTLILCMTPSAFESDWVGLERNTVLFRDPSNKNRRFIPLFMKDCTIPDTIRRYSYVDYRKQGNEAFEKLVSACKPEIETPKPEPEKKLKTQKPVAVFERTLLWDGDIASSVAISPDGKWSVSGLMYKREVEIWDLEKGEYQASLKGHTDRVNSVAITPNGKRILSASEDKTIRVWDAQTGQELTILEGHKKGVMEITVLSDGQKAVSGSDDKTLKLWDINSVKCIKTFEGHIDEVQCVAVTKNGKYAVSGSGDKTIKYWNLETGECLKTLTGHTDDVSSIQVTPDGRYAVSGSCDKTIKLWDLETGNCVGTYEGHQNRILSVAISPDGTLIASTSFRDFTLRLWDLKSGSCVQIIHEEGYFPFISVAFSPDGSRLIAGTGSDSIPFSGVCPIYIYRLTGIKPASTPEITRRYINAKVVLLGESGIGKSGLAHRLIEDKFVQTHSTHGMNVWRLDLPVETHDTLEREALLWDLAGQEDYRLIHQLFLEETALALLLINPQKDDPFAEAADWLKALRSAVCFKAQNREAVKLLISARIDVGNIRISRQKIKRFLSEHGFSDYLETSAKRGDNCSDSLNNGQSSELKQLIARHIPWDTLPWTSTPRLLNELKNAVMRMKEKGNVRLLRFPELVQRLEQALPDHNFDESDARTAVTLLANHGLVMPFKFGDLVLLQPEILNGYASAIIRSARSHTDEIGCVSEMDVFAGKIDFTGVDRLAPSDEELLLRAMVQTFLDKSLCIAEDTPQGRQLIFPSQYRRERDIPAHPEIFVSYTFSGEPATIYTTLVVRLWYSREFDNKELWCDAAEFSTITKRTAGFVMKRMGEGQATISVFFDTQVPEELKVVFIEYVHQHLHKYAQDVCRDRRYVCCCGKAITDTEAVRNRLSSGKNFIYCQECDEQIPLIDHIEKRRASDPVARKVMSMDKKANGELDIQAIEQILTGHLMAICGEANQIFRLVSINGIDGEVEFKDNNGKPSGKKIYVILLKKSFKDMEKSDRKPVIELDADLRRNDEGNLQNDEPIWLVIRDTDETIRWMNITEYLKAPKKPRIVFEGEKLDAPAIWRLRDKYISPKSS